VLYKAGLINNSTLKRVGISLFLKGRNHEELEVSARKYAEQIKLNDIYRTHYVNTDGEKWVVSASPEIYLKYLFPGEYVAGTRFTYSSDQVKGLDINMFGPEKKCFFLKMGITNITELYTDSMTDKPLMDIAESVFIINQGKINQLK
jgi:phosphoserine phosphatase